MFNFLKKKKQNEPFKNKQIELCYYSVEIFLENLDKIIETDLYNEYIQLTPIKESTFFKGFFLDFFVDKNKFYINNYKKTYEELIIKSDFVLDIYKNISNDILENKAITNSIKIKPIIISIKNIKNII